MKKMKNRRQWANRAAFTLMEVMLVLVIIVVIAGLGIRTLGGSFEKAKVNAAKASLSTLSNSVKEYQIEFGNLPQSLEALVSQPSDVEAGAWFAKLDKLPMDPWNKPFEYKVTGSTFEIKSNGPDGVAGTADDITN